MTGEGKCRVLLLFGGRSTEHGVSCVSAAGVMSHIDAARFEIVPVGITPEGQWVLFSGTADDLTATEGELPRLSIDRYPIKVALDPVPGERALIAEDGRRFDVDVVFPVLHGPYGEDGTIQGLLEMADLPYVGSGVFASSAGMDKAHMKALFAAAGLSVGPWMLITDAQWRHDRQGALDAAQTLGYPIFVKPARAGSSLGIVKAHDADELVAGIAFAREHDHRIVLEAGIEGGREIECGILAGADGARPGYSVCAEIRVREGHEFYDFEAKYLDDSADLLVPAPIPDEVAHDVGRLAVKAFEALDAEGLARVDFFLTAEGDVLINEINTMPGFTPISMYPRMWGASGVPYTELITRLLDDALTRGVGLR